MVYEKPAVQCGALIISSTLLPELEIIAVKWHTECELCAPQLRATAIRCRAQTAECGTMWGGPPMSVPPPFSLAAAGRDTMLEHGNRTPVISRGAGP